MIKSAAFLIFCLIFPFISNGQKWVADSITVGFGTTDTIAGTFNIVEATDLRSDNHRLLSVYEQKKALFFPVDQLVKTKTTLSDALLQRFNSNTNNGPDFGVTIHEFYIKNSTAGSKRNLTLFSTIELAKFDEKDTSFLGTFYYEQSFIQKKKLPVQLGYGTLIDKWSKNFTSDVLVINQGLTDVVGDQLYHFRQEKRAVRKNFYTGIEFFAGLDFWGFDGELWFSEPEGSRIFNRSIGVMRYVNHPDVQAIAIGRNVRLWNYRISEKWLFTHKLAMLIGFNNWKNMSTVAHKLEEIPYFNVSFSQSINSNQLDRSGLVVGIGLMEDVHYIIYHKPKLNVGISLNCAYKF